METKEDENMPMTKQEAAAFLRVSIRAVERLIDAGQIPVTKIGRTVRINRADVLALVPPGGKKPTKETP